jgi:HD-GYP domain-containing protein (c-di-GMP phosphodiesterase class II)
MPLTDLYPTTELQRLGSNLSLLHQPPEHSGPWIHRKKDGSRIAVEIISHGMVFQKRAAQLVLSNDITDRLRAESETRQRMNELEAINRISIALRSAQALDEMLPPLLDEVLAIVDGAAGGIWFRDPGEGDPRLITAKGWTGEGAAEATRPSLIRAVLASGSAIRWTEDQPGPDGHTGPAGAGLPIRADHEVIGALLVHTRHSHPISDPDLRLLSTLTEIAGNAIQRTHLYEQTQKRLQRIAALHVIDTAISSNMFLPETLNILLDQVLQQLEVDAADVLIFDRLSQRYEFVSGRGFRTRRAETTFLLSPPLPPVDLPFNRLQIALYTNLHDAGFGIYPNEFPHPDLAEAEGFIGYARVPLFSNGVINGYLEVYQRQKLQPDSEWLSFFETLAGQAQIAIDNATLLHNLQRSNRELTLAYDATIEGWSRALDLRDRETEGHTQRVTQMVMKLAQALNIPEAELAHIRRGALLHDIGKLGIPDNILLKPGPLTDDEWEIMRRHPIYAYEMLAPIPYLRPALDIPYCHHEKWDGSGYPRHLQGEQIPLAARLFAVTDVWDALRSDRPYRSGWPVDRLRDYIQEQSGSHFDPLAVNLFFDVVVRE